MSNSLDLMNRMGLVNEDSINTKQRNIKRVENAFNNGVSNYIRCFAVLTAENPDSKKASNAYNKKANKEFMSVSQFKNFSKCPNAALAEINGKYEREKTTALLVGSYVDSYFEGTLANFIRANPEIFKKDGTLKSDYTQAEAIIQRILQDKLFCEYMSGEKQVIMTGEIAGVPVKIKIDSLHPDKIVDLKVMANFNAVYDGENGSQAWFEAWGYDLQGAVYQEVVRQNTGKKLPFITCHVYGS